MNWDLLFGLRYGKKPGLLLARFFTVLTQGGLALIAEINVRFAVKQRREFTDPAALGRVVGLAPAIFGHQRQSCRYRRTFPLCNFSRKFS